ncbi:MEI2-like protein 1 [Actinidia rufa]|uniref:MEI2-like protein 1 n=1 Tax=Actinidia rufa TaxID=165716 RepID=A0A7J0DFG9_9ERIC|nr:MEI2-like protein 1 [Actinidia rufa]
MDGVLGTARSVPSSPFEKQIPVESKMLKPFEWPGPYLIQDQKFNFSLEKHAVGPERASSNGFSRSVAHDLGARSNLNTEPASYFVEGDEIRVVGTQNENGLFSSSLSELFSRKFRLTSNNALHGHSVGDVASHYEEEEPFESLEEMEAQTIGNLLPNDDELLSGVTDGIDYVGQPNTGEEIEDLDLFSSVGGMDLGEDGFPPGQRDSEFTGGNINSQSGGSVSSVVGEHPYGEHPSRTLFVRNINTNVEDSELEALFEGLRYDIIYYDIRAARNAMRALQDKPLRRRKLDIHFSIPKDNPSEKDINQGTLAAFNLDSSVSNEVVHQIFGVYGEIKEISEIPQRSHGKFIEFYDVRAAEAALRALNMSDIAGKKIKIEPSRPGGARECLLPPFPPDSERDECGPYLQQSSPPSNSTTGFTGMVYTQQFDPLVVHLWKMFSIMGSHLVCSEQCILSNESGITWQSIQSPRVCGHSKGQLKVEFHGSLNFHPHSFPEYHDGYTNGAPGNSLDMAVNFNARPSDRIENRQFCRVSSNGQTLELNDAVFGFSGNVNVPSPGHHYMWSSSPQPQPQEHHLICGTHFLPINSQRVGSAPSANPSLWDRRHTRAGESPNASGFHPGSLGNMRISGNSPHHLEFVSQSIFSHVGGNCMDLPIPSKNVGLPSPDQRCLIFPDRGQMIPLMSPFDSPNGRARSRRNDGSANQADNKKQFELDIDRIMRGDDNRTTLMIKNIPNKYTSKLLLAAIDERHKGAYDFIYLPIDFKASFLFFSPRETLLNGRGSVFWFGGGGWGGGHLWNSTYDFIYLPFAAEQMQCRLCIHQHDRSFPDNPVAFNGKKWEKFNSEKVASLAYGRIQGKAALIAHFQNSSLMNEDKRCRPILFNPDGPNSGDENIEACQECNKHPLNMKPVQYQVPFPMGMNIRPRPSKTRSDTCEEDHQESTSNLPNGEESFSWGLLAFRVHSLRT